MATVWIRAGLIDWLKGAPETRRADTPLRGSPEEGDEPLYDQAALDDAVAAGRNELLAALTRLFDCYSTSNSPETRMSCWDQARAAISNAKGA